MAADPGNPSGLGERQASHALEGRRFYSPAVIATYCALVLPLGLVLYGLNVARRGERTLGYSLAGFSAVLGLVPGGAVGATVSGLTVFAIFIGMGLMSLERGPFRAALARGGAVARWWPPLLWLICILIGYTAVLYGIGKAGG